MKFVRDQQLQECIDQAMYQKGEALANLLGGGKIEFSEIAMPLSMELKDEVSRLSQSIKGPFDFLMDRTYPFGNSDLPRFLRFPLLYDKKANSLDMSVDYVLRFLFGGDLSTRHTTEEIKKLCKIACCVAGSTYTLVHLILSDTDKHLHHVDSPVDMPFSLSPDKAGITLSRSLIHTGVKYGVHAVDLVSDAVERKFVADSNGDILNLLPKPYNIEFKLQNPETLLLLLDRRQIHTTPTSAECNIPPVRIMLNADALPIFGKAPIEIAKSVIDLQRDKIQQVFGLTGLG